jgi:hypothetical protein
LWTAGFVSPQKEVELNDQEHKTPGFSRTQSETTAPIKALVEVCHAALGALTVSPAVEITLSAVAGTLAVLAILAAIRRL